LGFFVPRRRLRLRLSLRLRRRFRRRLRPWVWIRVWVRRRGSRPARGLLIEHAVVSVIVFVARRAVAVARFLLALGVSYRVIDARPRAFRALLALEVVPILVVAHRDFSGGLTVVTNSPGARSRRFSSVAWRMPSGSVWAKIVTQLTSLGTRSASAGKREAEPAAHMPSPVVARIDSPHSIPSTMPRPPLSLSGASTIGQLSDLAIMILDGPRSSLPEPSGRSRVRCTPTTAVCAIASTPGSGSVGMPNSAISAGG